MTKTKTTGAVLAAGSAMLLASAAQVANSVSAGAFATERPTLYGPR